MTSSRRRLSVEVRVNQSSDDAEEIVSSGAMRPLDSTDLELVFDGRTDQLVGMRFQDVEVPAGATITSAYLEFEVDETHNVDPSTLTIAGEDCRQSVDVHQCDTGDISSRTQTAAEVVWAPDAWDTVGCEASVE